MCSVLKKEKIVKKNKTKKILKGEKSARLEDRKWSHMKTKHFQTRNLS